MAPRPSRQPHGCVPCRLNLSRRPVWAYLQSGSLGEEGKPGICELVKPDPIDWERLQFVIGREGHQRRCHMKVSIPRVFCYK